MYRRINNQRTMWFSKRSRRLGDEDHEKSPEIGPQLDGTRLCQSKHVHASGGALRTHANTILADYAMVFIYATSLYILHSTSLR